MISFFNNNMATNARSIDEILALTDSGRATRRPSRRTPISMSSFTSILHSIVGNELYAPQGQAFLRGLQERRYIQNPPRTNVKRG